MNAPPKITVESVTPEMAATLLGTMRGVKALSRTAAWDIHPRDYAAEIAEHVRSARQWHRIYRERRAQVSA
jgi:hypothetical protein